VARNFLPPSICACLRSTYFLIDLVVCISLFFMKLSCVYLDDWFHLVPPVLFIWFFVHFKNLKRSLVRSWFIPYPFYDPIIGESYAGCMCNRLGWMQVKHLLTLMICLHDFAKQQRTAERGKETISQPLHPVFVLRNTVHIWIKEDKLQRHWSQLCTSSTPTLNIYHI
jgi:hypothetical protein